MNANEREFLEVGRAVPGEPAWGTARRDASPYRQIRNPKHEIRRNPETRIGNRKTPFLISPFPAFGFPSDFDIRYSDFLRRSLLPPHDNPMTRERAKGARVGSGMNTKAQRVRSGKPRMDANEREFLEVGRAVPGEPAWGTARRDASPYRQIRNPKHEIRRNPETRIGNRKTPFLISPFPAFGFPSDFDIRYSDFLRRSLLPPHDNPMTRERAKGARVGSGMNTKAQRVRSGKPRMDANEREFLEVGRAVPGEPAWGTARRDASPYRQIRNPKHEIRRNPETRIGNRKTPFLISPFPAFGFPSDFDIRYSDFRRCLGGPRLPDAATPPPAPLRLRASAHAGRDLNQENEP